MQQQRTLYPALVLAILAPIVGELLPGSSPPLKFFNPFTLFFLCAVYGCGVLLIRELTVRWSKGWATMLLLGVAFGILYEGLLLKSIFDPAMAALGPLARYGRWLGVNWVWGVERSIYHAVFSIGIPIMLSIIIFPGQRGRSWMSWRTFSLLASLLSLMVLIGYLFSSSYYPPFLYSLLVCVLILALGIVAHRLPRTIVIYQGNHIARPLAFAIVGFVATALFFLINWLLPYTFIPAPFTIACTVGLAVYTARTVLSMSGNALGWLAQHQLGLLWGALTFFMLLAPFKEVFSGGRPNAGMTFVALIALASLIFLSLWLRNRGPKTEWV